APEASYPPGGGGRGPAGAGPVCAGELLRRAGHPHRFAGGAFEGIVRLWILAGGPAMLLAGGILLLHRGRPVALRTAGALLLALTAGALFHTIFAGGTYPLSGEGVLKSLWTSGIALKAGGAVS